MSTVLLSMAIADAYAMGWEFLKEPTEAPVHDWSGYKGNPQIPSYVASKYSDDTMRSLINARVMLEADPFNPLAYVRIMKEEFRKDGRYGWSRKFRAHLTAQLDRPDEEWLQVLMPRNTNGGIMGAAVCGFLAAPEEVIRAAETQALVTHDEEAAVYASACALALYGLRTGAAERSRLHAYACAHDVRLAALMPTLPEEAPAPSMLASDTYATVMRILAQCNDFRGILDRTIAHGGDTDSIASVAVAIASAGEDFVENYPHWAVEDLECGDAASRDRLLDTGRSLAEMSIGNTIPPRP